MPTAEEYQKFARECLKWADETNCPDAYEAFLDLAQHWTYAALLAANQPSVSHDSNT